jgi:hypothetical protein
MQARYGISGLAAVIGVTAIVSGPLTAQQNAAQKNTVTVVRVKPDAIDTWLDFQQKRTVPALKKAGVTQRTVYQTIYGPTGEYHILQPIGKYAERDDPQSPIQHALGATAAKEYNDALRKMIESQQTMVIESVPDASLPNQTPGVIHPLLVLTTVHVAPGKVADYLAYLRGDRLAAEKKGQAKRFTTSRVVFGGDNNEFRLANGEDKFSDFDGPAPVVRALGQDGAAKLAARLAGVVLSSDRVVLRRVEALSFSPSTASR